MHSHQILICCCFNKSCGITERNVCLVCCQRYLAFSPPMSKRKEKEREYQNKKKLKSKRKEHRRFLPRLCEVTALLSLWYQEPIKFDELLMVLKNKDIRTDNQFLGQLQINHRLLKHRENHLRHFWSIWKHSVVGCPTVLRRDERSQRVFLERRGVATRTNNPPPPGGGGGCRFDPCTLLK